MKSLIRISISRKIHSLFKKILWNQSINFNDRMSRLKINSTKYFQEKFRENVTFSLKKLLLKVDLTSLCISPDDVHMSKFTHVYDFTKKKVNRNNLQICVTVWSLDWFDGIFISTTLYILLGSNLRIVSIPTPKAKDKIEKIGKERTAKDNNRVASVWTSIHLAKKSRNLLLFHFYFCCSVVKIMSFW